MIRARTVDLHWLRPIAIAVAGLAVAASDARASGFQVHEQSSSKQGNAFAGAGSSGDDLSIMFFNPAGLARFDRPGVELDTALAVPSIRFTPSRATDGTGGTISGGDGGDAGQGVVIPSLYAAYPVTDRFNLGLAVNEPFGLETSYDEGWVGRYHALTSELQTVQISALGSYRVTDRFSIGGGPYLAYTEARLGNAIDFGTVCAGSLGTATCSALGVSPQGADGGVELDGHDWGVGGALGVLYEPVDGTRIGLSYRSHVRVDITADADFSVPSSASFLTASGAFTDGKATATVTLPETLGLSLHHDIDPQWAVMADAVWTRWERFDELRVRFDNSAQPDSVTDENWHNAMFYSVGATWRPDPEWTLRVGAAYEESPIDDAYRTARIPGADRYWGAFGADWRPADGVKLSVGYSHVWVDGASLDQSSSTAGTLQGSYDSSIDIFSLGLSIRF